MVSCVVPEFLSEHDVFLLTGYIFVTTHMFSLEDLWRVDGSLCVYPSPLICTFRSSRSRPAQHVTPCTDAIGMNIPPLTDIAPVSAPLNPSRPLDKTNGKPHAILLP